MGRVPLCAVKGCLKNGRPIGCSYKCGEHGGGRRCAIEGCNNLSRSRVSEPARCGRHGAVPDCAVDGCTVKADLPSKKCRKHGSLKCVATGCANVPIGPLHRCVRHGGGYRRKIVSQDRKIKADGKCDGKPIFRSIVVSSN